MKCVIRKRAWEEYIIPRPQASLHELLEAIQDCFEERADFSWATLSRWEL